MTVFALYDLSLLLNALTVLFKGFLNFSLSLLKSVGSTGLYFLLVNIAVGGIVGAGRGVLAYGWGGQQIVCVKPQYNFMVGMVFKEWNIRIAVMCFDDQLCCILTQCMSWFLWCSSGK